MSLHTISVTIVNQKWGAMSEEQIIRRMVKVLFENPGRWPNFQRLSQLVAMPGIDAIYLAAMADFRSDLFAVDHDRRLKLRHEIVQDITMQTIERWRVPVAPTYERYQTTGTIENPQLSLKEDFFNGYPVVEILSNGGPIHVWDSHFRFGQRKAEIVIACLAVLRDFWRSDDYDRRAFRPQILENQRRGLRIRIYVEMQQDFEHSTGTRIDRPVVAVACIAS